MRVHSRTLLCCAVLALALAAPALAEDPPAKSEQQAEKQAEKKAPAKKKADKTAATKAQEKVDKAKKGADEPIVFTNGDLEALFGRAQPSASPAPAPGGAVAPPRAPAATPGQTAQADKNKARIQQIQAEIKRLNEMNRSLRNPYLRRVQTTDEEKKVYANKGSDERIRINNERIAALRQELAKLQSAPAASPAGAKSRSTR